MKVIKIFWYLSIIVIFLFYLFFEGYRVYDYISNNYSIKKMIVNDYSYDSTSKRQNITVKGYINNQPVYFYRFDKDINKLHELYPAIFSDDIKNKKEISVLKFEHSRIVMLVDDNEFQKWKKQLIIFSSYILCSLIIIFFNRLNLKK